MQKEIFHLVKSSLKLDKKLLKEMSSMASWSLFGFIAAAGKGQGVNVLLNIFHGVLVNAARGVAFQVDGVVRGFVNNFQTAINPQITKAYASNNIKYMNKVMQQGSKISFYLLFFITLPLLIETDFVLQLWLKDVPEYTILFCRLILINSLIESLSGPLITAAYATGHIKKLQIIVSLFHIFNSSFYILLFRFWFRAIHSFRYFNCY